MEQLDSRPPNKVSAWIAWLRERRIALAALAVLPVAGTLALGLRELPAHATFEFPCPIHPNGTIAMTASFYESCPLEFPDHLAAVVVAGVPDPIRSEEEVRAPIRRGHPVRYVIRSSERGAYEIDLVPVLLRPAEAAARLAAALLLATILSAAVLLTAVRASVPASLPFTLIHAAAGVGIVTTVAGWTSSAFELPAAIARATTAAALLHLGLVFPQRRSIVEVIPGLIAMPYVFAAILCAVEIDTAYRGSAISAALAQRLIMAGMCIAGAVLGLSCLITAQESRSHVARSQARVFLAGIAGLVLPVALVWAGGSPSARLTAITLFAALMPFPVGYAISRYQVPDLDHSLRRLMAHALYLSLWAGGAFLTLRVFGDRIGVPEPLRHPTVMFATVYATLAPIDAGRGLLKRRLRRLLISQHVDWDRLGLEYAQRIAAQRKPEAVASVACEAIEAGVSKAGVAFFLDREAELHLTHARGPRSFVDASIASHLLAASPQCVVDVNRLDATDGAVADAYAAGIGAIANVESGGSSLGCIVILPERRGRLLSASEQLWIATIAGHAASALLALHFERELRVSERFAARGRMEAELAHEIGKPLGVLELTARALAEQIDPGDPLAPQLGKIAGLAVHVREVARGALLGEEHFTESKLVDLVQCVCAEIRALHGEGRVCVHPLPEPGGLDGSHRRLVRVLVNLLDNALRASPSGAVVDLCVRATPDRLVFCVEDRGVGMSAEQLRCAFDPFMSFRPGGTGLGLSISRQLVVSFGGTLRLEPRSGGGTRAVLSLPLPGRSSSAL